MSVNKAFRSIARGNYCTNIKSKEYRQYESDCLKLLPKRKMIEGEVAITVEYFLKQRYKTTDLNNFSKPLYDILETVGYFENDNKIVEEHLYKYDSDEWKINIVINKA